jgi:hypothetical protein
MNLTIAILFSTYILMFPLGMWFGARFDASRTKKPALHQFHKVLHDDSDAA